MSDEAILEQKRRRLRVLQEQQARHGIDTRPEIILEIEELEAAIARLADQLARASLPRPPQPDIAHPYPLQSGFAGRVTERSMLSEWLRGSSQPVLAVIGIGGMGKSALTWAWVQRDVLGLPLPNAAPEPPAAAACRLPEAARPEGVLWWSFYESQASFAAFLNEAIGYASDWQINPRDIPTIYEKARALLGLLQRRRLLLVLDGFERELRAYASLGAAYQGDAVEKQAHSEHRACAEPQAGRFLRDAATLPLQSRILISSRLFPRELDELGGCGRSDLKTIHPDDAVAFFQAQGIRGTRAEIQAACAPYGYHALALRLLAGLIRNDPTRPRDIGVAVAYNAAPDLVQREHHILELAYNVLRPPLRGLLGMLAAFRSPVDFATLQAIDQLPPEQPHGFVALVRRMLQRSQERLELKAGLKELEERGLLFFDREQARYDMHPVVRGYAYERLLNRQVVHVRLIDYFTAIPVSDEEKVQSLDDLAPAIELYHHLARAGRYQQAHELFRDRLGDLLFYRLGAHRTCIELLGALFPDGEEHTPQLKDAGDQAWALIALAGSYYFSGQLRQAMPLVERSNLLCEKADEKGDLTRGLVNLALAQIVLGELAGTERNLRRDIELCRESEDEFQEAVGHQELGRLLAHQGMFEEAEKELATSTHHWEQTDDNQGLCLDEAYRTLCALLNEDAPTALACARRARELADVKRHERDVIQTEWLLGAALLAQAANSAHTTPLIEAETHLSEALARCRKIDLVEFEPDILLAWARWHWLQGHLAQARTDAEEALAIAARCEHRLKQADIHNFLARLALEAGDRAAARRHAEQARERAWCDGPPHCYKPALDEAERLLAQL